jgi:hypothetical protein
MAAKIHGYQWEMNYRGFDLYRRTAKTGLNPYTAVPSANLINKDLAINEHIHHGSFEDMICSIDMHFQVLEAMAE